MAWMPVAHRWVDDWDGHTLSVVFEFRGAQPGSAPAAAPPASGYSGPGFAAPTQGPAAAPYAAAPSPYAPPPATPSPYAPSPYAPSAYAPPAPATPQPPTGPQPEPSGWDSDQASSWDSDQPATDSPPEREPSGWDSEAAPTEAPAEATVEEAAAPEASSWDATGPSEAEAPVEAVSDSADAAAEAPAEGTAEAQTDTAAEAPSEAPADAAAESEGEPSAAGPLDAATDATAEPVVEAPADVPSPAPPAPTPPAPGPAAAPPPPPAAVGSQPQTAVRAHLRASMQTIDLHCAGEPLRLVRTGFPAVPTAPILERRRWAQESAEDARRLAIFEPRGHRDMYGAILLPPYRQDADVAVLFMHNEGYSTMCGHGIIAVTTALIEERLFPVTLPETVIRYETPAGLVTARAAVRAAAWGGPEVDRVRFTNVPAYLASRDIEIHPDGVDLAGRAAGEGVLRVDMAFGGAYYGVVDAADLGLRVVPAQIDALTRAGAAITEVLRRDHAPTHPTDPELGFVYGTIIVDGEPSTAPDGKARDADMRNVTIFADGEVDRSPCGTGTSALLAQHFYRGSVQIGRDLINAGITGEAFRGRVERQTTLGSQEAVETSIEGTAYVTGHHTFVVDDRDPLGGGFLLG